MGVPWWSTTRAQYAVDPREKLGVISNFPLNPTLNLTAGFQWSYGRSAGMLQSPVTSRRARADVPSVLATIRPQGYIGLYNWREKMQAAAKAAQFPDVGVNVSQPIG